MKIGIATSVFLNYSLQDAIKYISSAGYDAVDVWGGRPHIYREDFSKDELHELRLLIDDKGLFVSSFMPAFFRYPYSLSNPNFRVIQDSLDYMRQCMDNAVLLGAELLLIVPGRTLNNQTIEDARSRIIDSIFSLCAYSKQYPIKLGLEAANVAVTNFINTATDALSIVDEIGYENLGVVLDSGHMNLTNEPMVEAVGKLGKKLLQVHVNDNDGRRQQNLVPGEGNIDFTTLVEILRQVGFEGYLSAELAWDYSLNPIPAIELTAQRMRAMLSQKESQKAN